MLTGGGMLLLVSGVLLRGSGAALRAERHVLPVRLLGWQLASGGLWLASSGLGAWAPFWIAVLVGLTAALLEHREPQPVLRLLADGALVGGIAIASVGVPQGWLCAATLLVIAVAAGEALLARTPRRVNVVVAVAPLLVWISLGWLAPQRAERLAMLGGVLAGQLDPYLALVPTLPSERIVLETGAVAWLDRPEGTGPFRGALFFHGSDPLGARHRAAEFMRRTLVEAGFVVLAVDHPGYGDTPVPGEEAGVAAWDPLPHSQAALRWLLGGPEVEGCILAVGHSMGATEALRLLATPSCLAGAALLGAAATPSESETAGFYRRFHSDRGIDFLGRRLHREIEHRYYNNDAAAMALPSGHAPLLFVRFSHDYDNIVASRDRLLALIPGDKVAWTLWTNHNFSADFVDGLLVGDWQLMRDLSRGLRRFVDGRHPASGEPLPFRVP